MQAAIDQFNDNIARVRNLQALYVALSAQVTTAVDLSDILRAAIVAAVSALDQFVHEIVRLGMIETWNANRPETRNFQDFSITLASARSVAAGAGPEDWLDYEIRVAHGWQSFQRPEKVAEAIRLISNTPLWDSVANVLKRPPADVRAQLELVVDRRNKIAHEADIDPSFPNTRWPIDPALTTDVADFIESLCKAIFQAL